MSLDEETLRKREEFEAICKRYQGTLDFKEFYKQTEVFRNRPELLDKDGRCTLYLNLGYHSTQPENYLEAIGYFKKALKNLDRNDIRPKHKIIQSNIYREIGCIYCELGDKYKNQATEAFKQYFLLKNNSWFTGFSDVYSYRTINKYFLQDLIKNEITVVSPTLFNDPVDIPLLLSIKKDQIKSDTPIENAASYFKIRSFVSNVSIKGINKQKNNISIDEYKNILMWSHYADSHKGVCVKYKLLGQFLRGNLESQETSYFADVVYEDKLEYKKRTKLSIQEAFASKNRCWEYENEVRLIHYDPNCNSPVKALPLSKTGKIEAIYFGLQCPEKDIDTIKAILGDNVAYFKMKVDDEDLFKLVEVPRNDKAKAMLEAANEVPAETVE